MRRFSPVMKCVALRYLGETHDAEDAVQEAWMSFIRSAAGIHSPESLVGWLKVTTARRAIAIGKRRRRHVPTAFGADHDIHSIEPEPPALDDEERRTVSDAVRRLRGEHRELIELLFSSELSYAEIVTHTGRPIGSIGPTRKRALEKLRRDRAIQALHLARAS